MPRKWNRERDIVIVGSGFAGLASAIETHDGGANVIILEKMPTAGGNSIMAGGAYNAVDPELQELQSIEDSVSLHYKDSIEGGDYRGEPEKVWFLVKNALNGLHWLEEIGVKFSNMISQGFGALWPRAHRSIGPRSAIVRALIDQVKRRGIPVLLRHKVTRIIREKALKGRVLGVEVETQGQKLLFKARKAVILASGGFGADVEMRMKHDPRFDTRFSTTNHAGATGECIKMACDIGADLKGMDYIQYLPVGRDIKVGKRGVGQRAPINLILGLPINRIIFSDLKGERIVASDARRDHITEAIMATDEKVVVVIGDDACREAHGTARINAEKLVKKYPNEVFIAKTIRELAINMDMTPEVLENTIKTFNSYVVHKHDPEFGQSPHNLKYKIEKPPFWAGTASPSVHHTMGGLAVKGTTTQVIDRYGKVIPRLYAVGEVTGGVHGTNRLGGNAIPECIVFGRVAGKNAAREKSW